MWKQDTSSKDGAPASSAPVRAGHERRLVAWVGKSVVFKGELTSSEDMIIDGRVEGRIDVSDHHVTIGPEADIRADISARAVTIRGKVNGTVTARETVHIEEGAVVTGDVTSPRLAMSDGAVLTGKVAAGAKAAAAAATQG